MARSSEDKLERICTGIYRQLYREATPSADFDLLVKTGEAFNPKFFAKYYLPDARTSEIIKLHCKKKQTLQARRQLDLKNNHTRGKPVWRQAKRGGG